MRTVVPVLLIRSKRLMMPSEVAGSRLPVGSSASRISGRLTKARATATRCCSPPESSFGRLSCLWPSPTSSRTCGTCVLTTDFGRPITSRAKATFSNTVLLGRSRKSWNTQPMLRRRKGTRHLGRLPMSRPASMIRPSSGTSSRSNSRRKVVLPDPDEPTRKTNSPLSMSTDTSLSATVVVL